MLEYVFFHKVLAEKFAKKVREYNIETKLIEEEPAWEVHVPEDIEEETEQEISDFYDDFFDKDQEMFEQENQDDDSYGAAAIEITLKNGEKVNAQTDQKILGKVLSTISFDEFNQLINDITFAIENPDSRTICERYRDLKESK